PGSATGSQSAWKGVNGASRPQIVVSASCSVVNAARVSSVSPLPQNRSRLRRTYQFDRSSTTKSAIARAACVSSYWSRYVRTCAATDARRDRSQRSSTSSVRAEGSGVQSSRFAESAKKRYVFAIVSNTRRHVSVSASGSKRFDAQGWLTAMKYQRIASAPNDSIASHGSTTLPRDFDIFWPSASSTSPFTTTFR